MPRGRIAGRVIAGPFPYAGRGGGRAQATGRGQNLDHIGTAEDEEVPPLPPMNLPAVKTEIGLVLQNLGFSPTIILHF